MSWLSAAERRQQNVGSRASAAERRQQLEVTVAPAGAVIIFNMKLTRICASLGLRMKCKTLFMSSDEKHSHHFDLPPFFNMSKQFLAPGGLSAECVQVSVM